MLYIAFVCNFFVDFFLFKYKKIFFPKKNIYIVLYCIMRPYTNGPIGPQSYRHSSGVVRNPHSALTE